MAVALPPVLWTTDARADWLLGAKAGVMQVKFDEVDPDDDPLNVGVLAGYSFDTVIGRPALELDLTRSVSPGSVGDADLEVDTLGLYVAWRTSGELYVKGRLGLMQASLGGELGDLAEDENGETYGVGVGWRLGRWAAELDYTSIDDDVAFLSAGFVYRPAR